MFLWNEAYYTIQVLAELAKERQAAGLLAALRPQDQGQSDMGSRNQGQSGMGPRDQPDTDTELGHNFPLSQTRQILTESGWRTETSV